MVITKKNLRSSFPETYSEDRINLSVWKYQSNKNMLQILKKNIKYAFRNIFRYLRICNEIVN